MPSTRALPLTIEVNSLSNHVHKPELIGYAGTHITPSRDARHTAYTVSASTISHPSPLASNSSTCDDHEWISHSRFGPDLTGTRWLYRPRGVCVGSTHIASPCMVHDWTGCICATTPSACATDCIGRYGYTVSLRRTLPNTIVLGGCPRVICLRSCRSINLISQALVLL